MAKKTSYLTELIERHERWKAEGGERQDDEEAADDDITFGFWYSTPVCLFLTSL